MKVRFKNNPDTIWYSGEFNIHALSEIIVQHKDLGADSVFIKDLDVLLATGEWKDMRQAFKEHSLIVDNYNTYFFEPKTAEEKERGFTL